jgi:hypothetical protein
VTAVRAWVPAIAVALIAGCATTVALDSTDRRYVQGLESYRAGRCSGTKDSLFDFYRSEAIVHSDRSVHLGVPRPELDPPTSVLKERARATLEAAWASTDRSGKLRTAFINEMDHAYRLESASVSLDLREAKQLGPSLPGDEMAVYDLNVPAGNHVLHLIARIRADVKGVGLFLIVSKGAQSLTVKAGESVRVLMRTYLTSTELRAFPPERVAFDFVVTPTSAKP